MGSALSGLYGPLGAPDLTHSFLVAKIVLIFLLYRLLGWPFFVAAILNIIPLHPIIIDSLICTNLAISFTLFIAALWRPKGIYSSIFHWLLTATNLFRLWLLIASMRQIIINANAGEIIFHLGKTVTFDNDWIMGIALALVSLAQLLPLMIDNKSIKKEAIAMCIINLTIFFGSCAIGVYSYSLPLVDVARFYSILTVGNALVFLLPMLLTSTATTLVGSPNRQISF